MEHRRLRLLQESLNALGGLSASTVAERGTTAVAQYPTRRVAGQDSRLQIAVIIEQDLNSDPSYLVCWPLHFGNRMKGSLPELPVEWIPSDTRQTRLVTVECPILPHLPDLVEDAAPILKITKHIVFHLRVPLFDPLVMEQVSVQPEGEPVCGFASETRGFRGPTFRSLPKSAHRWLFSGSTGGGAEAAFFACLWSWRDDPDT
jgi:hypothetical protein